VVFVGAGPGDPDLITVAGKKALETADLIVYAGSLVADEMLAWAGPQAERVDSAGLTLEQTTDLLVQGYNQGKRVVRLHSGDPSLFGAIREQIDLLGTKDVPWRVIPGVTAAMAAAAALGLEYTIPERTQTLILSRAPGRTPVPGKENLDGLAGHRASLVIYLSAGLADKVSAGLEKAYGPESPVAVVYRASWPDQRIVWTTPERLPADLKTAGIDRQAVILVGPGVAAVAPGREGEGTRSKLYDPTFSHGHRRGRDE
jgi:precorrin-4/cobalt-precorrin-4 C11-methyltransferase